MTSNPEIEPLNAAQAEVDRVVDDINAVKQNRETAKQRFDEAEAEKADLQKALADHALGKGPKPKTLMSTVKAKLDDAVAEVQAYEAALKELNEKSVLLHKALKNAKEVAHDVEFGRKLTAYLDAEEVFVEKYYRPLIAAYLEDSRRLPAFFNPFYDPAAQAHRRAQANAFLNRNVKPTPVRDRNVVLMRLLKPWPGSSRDSALGWTNAFNEGEVAGFSRAVADHLEKEKFACLEQ